MNNLNFETEQQTYTYDVSHAVKGPDYIHGYRDDVLVIAFEGITDFSKFMYDSEYLTPEEYVAEECNTVKHVGGELYRKDGTKIQLPHKPDIYYGTSINDAPKNAPDGTVFILISS